MKRPGFSLTSLLFVLAFLLLGLGFFYAALRPSTSSARIKSVTVPEATKAVEIIEKK